MRLISCSVVLLAVLSSTTLAQQSPGTTGDTIGRPPPLPGPPPISEPSTTSPSPAASTPQASQRAPKVNRGHAGPRGRPTPSSTVPRPQVDGGPDRKSVV